MRRMNYQKNYHVLCIGSEREPGAAFQAPDSLKTNAKTVARYFRAIKNQAQITCLTGKDADKTSILNWLTSSNEIPGKTTVILYYSGHISVEKNTGNKYQRSLCLESQTAPGDNDKTCGLTVPGILKKLTNPDHQLMVVIDGCYHLPKGLSPREAEQSFQETESITSIKRYVSISGFATHKKIFEDPDLGRGVLTHYFLNAMAGKYTSCLKKEIPILRLLDILKQKVHIHRFPTVTGRKRSNRQLVKNGVMLQHGDKNFYLPILEPVPRLEPTGRKSKTKQSLLRIFTLINTRKKRVLARFALTLFIISLLTLILNIAIGQVLFHPLFGTIYGETLTCTQGIRLSGLKGEHAGKSRFKPSLMFFFNHNWTKALESRLNAKGKLILNGYLLGSRIEWSDKNAVLNFALKNPKQVLYWNLPDIEKLIDHVGNRYRYLKSEQKSKALELLVQLGENGRQTASSIFDWKTNRDKTFRNLSLKHSFSSSVWERNFKHFTIDDYLYLIAVRQPAPVPERSDSKRYIKKYLLEQIREMSPVEQSIITSESVTRTYKRLQILAYFRHPAFRQLALPVLKQAFEPEEVIRLFRACSKQKDREWVLDYFLNRAPPVPSSNDAWHWFNEYIRLLPAGPRYLIIKRIMNQSLLRIPGKHRQWYLYEIYKLPPRFARLDDWEKWIKNSGDMLSPYQILFTFLKLKYKNLYPFFQRHYSYFKGEFDFYYIKILETSDSVEAAENWAKELLKTGTSKERLHAASYLIKKNPNDEAAVSILRRCFLEAAADPRKRESIKALPPERLEDWLTAKVKSTPGFKKNLEFLVNSGDKLLLYRYFKVVWHFWPRKVKQIVLESPIPYDSSEGILFLRTCEKLPEPERKQMIFKILAAELDETMRLNTEDSASRYYPEEFIKFVQGKNYKGSQFVGNDIINAYSTYSLERLREDIHKALKERAYWKIFTIADALIAKHKKGNLELSALERLLKDLKKPVARITLRELRYHINSCYFQSTGKM